MYLPLIRLSDKINKKQLRNNVRIIAALERIDEAKIYCSMHVSFGGGGGGEKLFIMVFKMASLGFYIPLLQLKVGK